MRISDKTNRVLLVISICMMMILIRSWYLSVIQHDYHVKMAEKPQRRIVIEKADRATIHDRFGVPLAVNKIQYNASVCYAHIRQIPTVRWKKNEKGEKTRVSERLEYVAKLSQKLSSELGIPARRIEDLIHGKAAMLPHTPFVIKEDLSEEQYYRLKGMEKDWLGLQIERVSRREYPLGKIGGDVIGYLGNIDSSRYLKIAHELNSLEDYLIAKQEGESRFLPEGFDSPEEVLQRYFDLQEKAYTMNDLVGKMGVEASYEEDLRGYVGKHIYEVDTKGTFVRELEGSRPAVPGKKVTLTLSAELQMFAEQLIASNEGSRLDKVDGGINEKWMRGSAVVAMIPKTGEIVALASYPRFNPNDFIPSRDPDTRKEKEFAVKQWLETDDYLGEVWDGKRSLRREYFSFVQGRYLEETLPLTWNHYLEAVLPGKSSLKNAMLQIHDVRLALQVQDVGIYHPLLREIKMEQDKYLAIDLCHLVAPLELFTPELMKEVGSQPLSDYFATRQEAMRLLSRMKEELRELFYDNDFNSWREAHFKEHLKEMRAKEKAEKKYAKPYTDYLDRVERRLWGKFWEAYKPVFLYTALTGRIPILMENYPNLTPYICTLKETYFPLLQGTYPLLHQKVENLSPLLGVAYLKTLRSFEELKRPLDKKYPYVRSVQGQSLEKHLAQAFYPPYGYGFTRSQSYRQATPPGSVFKLVVAYQTLLERHEKGLSLNPFMMVDDWVGSPGSKSFILGYLSDGTPLYRGYKGGRLPRSSHPGMGKLDMIGALEQSSNVYFSLAAGDIIQNPLTLAEVTKKFGMGEKTGIDLPGEARGKIPDDIDQNRTGLYSFAIGQHTLEVTPLQTALMTAAIANQGKVVRPHIVQKLEGTDRMLHHELLEEPNWALDKLSVQTTVHQEENIVQVISPETDRVLPFPSPIFNYLFEGMQRVVMGSRGTARPGAMRVLYDHPTSLRDYLEIHRDLVGKTGTAQVLYKRSISSAATPVMEHYICFSGISYPKKSILLPPLEKEPELVVVVSLRYRQAGLEGGPIAGQVIKKWREIQARHQ
ncbi:MAG: penicillin-binding transpeptidase domain-containing protein [Rhabdochlamydiaceae bacterium]|jgi:cell division protein FtsI/penicillin-binding protein 2